MMTESITPLLTTVGLGRMAGLEKQIEWIEAHSRSHYRYHYHAAFISLNFHFRKKVIKRMYTMFGNSSSYSCINCGTRHNEIACPKCGSKMKRADFHKF